MEDIKGKAVEVESGDMADVGLPIQGMGPPMRGDQGIGFHQENESNRVGALRRLSELRARRRLAAAAEGFGYSASVMQRHFVPKPIRPPPPPTTVTFLLPLFIIYSNFLLHNFCIYTRPDSQVFDFDCYYMWSCD